MHVIEFDADIEDGAIKLPSQYRDMDAGHVKVIAWVEETAANQAPQQVTNQNAPVPDQEERPFFADGYIERHWRELIITAALNPQEDDDAVLQEGYGAEFMRARWGAE
ncbi:hypothetical protein [Thiocapsa sp. UBA6158]|jgi:hypothetical protein|uniref:hypothetical protein n=1 Tax=Thiocapsa sp. UBA6158 TaxID=1947692 RepID=UPI0025E5AAF3|nr:hypothetical protein [Thiocapsa sp. UBA6158]NCA72687.1 hypothetical protein [Sphingobacteriia bacterium]